MGKKPYACTHVYIHRHTNTNTYTLTKCAQKEGNTNTAQQYTIAWNIKSDNNKKKNTQKKTKGYDGGDCNQLCDLNECNVNLWGNDICDNACNNTQCEFDNGDCGIVTNKYALNYNQTYCNYQTMDSWVWDGCKPEWVNDDWYIYFLKISNQTTKIKLKK